jgi:hypothetical protein
MWPQWGQGKKRRRMSLMSHLASVRLAPLICGLLM